MCYRTVSYVAVAVVSSISLLALQAEERTKMYRGVDKTTARNSLLNRWQLQWSISKKGRWTYRLIGDLTAWYNRKHDEGNFHLSQFLTGHGCFRYYLHCFGKINNDACVLCESRPDDAEHAICQCDAVDTWRREVYQYLEVEQLTLENIIGIMLASRESWTRVFSLIAQIMRMREEDERRRDLQAMQTRNLEDLLSIRLRNVNDYIFSL